MQIPEHLSAAQVAGFARAAGCPAGVLALALAVFFEESNGFQPGLVNVNADGSRDRGLAQVNSVYWSRFTDAQCFDPAEAMKIAGIISGGWKVFTAWNGYTSGQYKQYLPMMEKEVSTMGTTLPSPVLGGGVGGGGLADLPAIPFIAATRFDHGEPGRKVTVLVVHTAECPQTATAARGVAGYFAAGSEGRPASAHYVVDENEIVQCVRDEDIAYQAPPCNSHGIGVEHAGYAAQTAADWANAYNTKMLKLSALLFAHLCIRHGVPAVWLTPAQLRGGKSGIAGHRDVNDAFNGVGTGHRDPGVDFPKAHFVALIDEYLRK